MDNIEVESCLVDAVLEKIECILCDGFTIMSRNLINHMAEHHRVQGDVNFVLAGCFMKRNEREDIDEIFQVLIKNMAGSEVDVPISNEEIEQINDCMRMQEASPPDLAEDQRDNSSVAKKKETCNRSKYKSPTERARMKHTQGYHAKQMKLKKNKSEVMGTLQTETNEKTSDQERFNCGVCNSSFANKRGLKKHKKTSCGVRFGSEESSFNKKPIVNSKNGIFKKRQICSNEKSKDFQCVNCEISFSSSRSLWRHKQVCHGELIDIFQTSEYFQNHPLSIRFWNGADQDSLESDSSLPEGWKVKIVKRNVQRNGMYRDKQYYRPGFKFYLRSHIAMMEFIKYMEVKEKKQRKAELEEKLIRFSMKKNMSKINLDPELPDYFTEHSSLIYRWNGVESSLVEDPKLTGGWKIKLERRKTGKPSRHFVTPDRKYVIRSIDGVLEYLQHNDVQDDNIETLLETLLKMKNNRFKVKVPLMVEEGLSKDIDVNNVAEKRLKTNENVNKGVKIRNRRILLKSKSEQKEGYEFGGPNPNFNQEQNQELSKSKFKLEDWGSECKDKIRRLGKNIGDLVVDPKLPYGWKVRLYGKNSKSSSKDYVTPDGKYYVRSHKAVVKYMKLSGSYSDSLIRTTAATLGVDLLDIEIEKKKQTDMENKDSTEEITEMDDEKLLIEIEDEMLPSDNHDCDKCDEYRTRDLMELVLHKRLFHGLS